MDIKERINTILLCDIATHFGIKTDIEPEIVKYAITSGNQWILNAKYSLLDAIEETTKEDRDFITEILNMYRGLSSAIRKLPNPQQSDLIEKYSLRVDSGHIQIPGFDGNNEGDYFSIVDAYLKIDKFTEQKSPINDTHSETEDYYREMLKKYKELAPVNRSWNLTVEELSSVLDSAPVSC